MKLFLLFFLISCSIAPAINVNRTPNSIPVENSCQQVLQQLNSALSESPFGLGKMLNHQHQSTRSLADIKTLKIVSYNVENYFDAATIKDIPPDYWTFTTGMKVVAKKKQIAKQLQELDGDIIFLQEMGVESEAENLANHPEFLGGKWKTLFVPGNDRIHITVLVKKDLPLDLEVHGFENFQDHYLDHDIKTFVRNFLGIVVKSKDKPLMLLGGVHFKAPFTDAEGLDPRAQKRRTLEVQRSAEALKQLQQKYGNQLPYAVVGDMNSDFKNDDEFEALRKLNLTDAFDLKAPSGKTNRVTNVGVHRDSIEEKKQRFKFYQPDTIAVSPGIKVLTTEIKKHVTPEGKVAVFPPQTMKDYKQYNSDHMPIVGVIDFEKIVQEANQPLH